MWKKVQKNFNMEKKNDKKKTNKSGRQTDTVSIQPNRFVLFFFLQFCVKTKHLVKIKRLLQVKPIKLLLAHSLCTCFCGAIG